MSRWIKRKQDKYCSTNGAYIMSWNDVQDFVLYHQKTFIKAGSRDDCLEAFRKHKQGGQ